VRGGIALFFFLALANSFAWGQPCVVTETQKLLASDGAAGDFFGGGSSSVSGGVAVLAASLNDDNGAQSGSAYVYRFDGTAWVEEQKLTAADGAAGDFFGDFVSLSGNVAVVGATLNDDDGADSGSAYVFRFDGTSWVEEQKLTASDGAAGDRFGIRLSVSGNVAVVGAPLHDDIGANSGSAYVYRFDGTTWVEEQKLTASDAAADDEFGFSVSASGNVAVVGAHQDDDNGAQSGSAYVYRFDGTTWVQEQKLTAGDGAVGDQYSRDVSVSGNAVAIGAWKDDDNGADSGSAYLYSHDGTSWIEQQKLLASDGAAVDEFGISVSVDGSVVMVGSILDDDNGPDSGSVYAFDTGATALTLDVSPPAAQLGDILSFTTCGGVSGDFSLLFIVEFNGSPFFRLVAMVPFASDGCGTLSGEHNEPILFGSTLTFRAFAFNVCDSLEETNDMTVVFQNQ
jgi:hypothetical protein